MRREPRCGAQRPGAARFPAPVTLAADQKISRPGDESGRCGGDAAATCRLHLPSRRARVAYHGISTNLVIYMQFINESVMNGLERHGAFRQQQPYPWLNPKGFLHGRWLIARLVDTCCRSRNCSTSDSARSASTARAPRPVCRWTSAPDLPLAPAWRDFVDELQSRALSWISSAACSAAGRFACCSALALHAERLLGVAPLRRRRKLGSHIFYFNTDNDWQPDWGGETLILDDNGRFGAGSAPKFEDFDRVMPARGRRQFSACCSMRRERSWHGVKEIRCPPDHLRKVFIVVIEDWGLKARRAASLLPRQARTATERNATALHSLQRISAIAWRCRVR